MPILPENKARYTANWSSVVVPRIRKRSGDRCECTGQCGKHEGRCNAVNGTAGYWEKPGKFVHCLTGRDAVAQASPGDNWVRIVLTVMHLDHTPENCDDTNLLHGCQLCHNNYDMPHRRETKRAKKAVKDMFGGAS
jgi:hypothetical protein